MGKGLKYMNHYFEYMDYCNKLAEAINETQLNNTRKSFESNVELTQEIQKFLTKLTKNNFSLIQHLKFYELFKEFNHFRLKFKFSSSNAERHLSDIVSLLNSMEVFAAIIYSEELSQS
jgi:superoxide dismutase